MSSQSIFVSHGDITHGIEVIGDCVSCLQAETAFRKALEDGLMSKLKRQVAAYQNYVQSVKATITISEFNLDHELKKL